MTLPVLGLNLSFASSCALVSDGIVAAAVAEERFSRNKNEESFPLESMNYCTRFNPEVNNVFIASLEQDVLHRLTRFYSRFNVEDRVREQHEYWIPKLNHGQDLDWLDVFKDKLSLDQFPGDWADFLAEREKTKPEDRDEFSRSWIKKLISENFGFAKENIQFLDHHTVHASYGRAVFLDQAKHPSTGIVVLDAYGDGTSASVWRNNNDAKTKLDCLKKVDHKSFQLARIYRYVTLVLGMLPDQHEYKVMGLAPYNQSKYSRQVKEKLLAINWCEGLDFRFNPNTNELYQTLRSELEGFRFDQIASGLQSFSEELISTWVKAVIEEYGFENLIFSGGVAANIKALKNVRDTNKLKQILVPPAPGDESLGIGAAALGHCLINETDASFPTVYLGPSAKQKKSIINASSKQVETGQTQLPEVNLEFLSAPSDVELAQLLADGHVFGRCVDRMEFGPRALGNRSILADPRDYSVVQKINDKIKNRDFWMPFAPIILDDYAEEYLEMADFMAGAYMTLAFDTIAKQKLAAGVHPKDGTSRPQILQKAQNPRLYNLIYEFGKITGTFALLNTSFNLHGEPVVSSESDAYRVFVLSGLDGLILDNSTVLKT